MLPARLAIVGITALLSGCASPSYFQYAHFDGDSTAVGHDVESEVITVEVPDTAKFVPPKIAGDADFDGHGPSVTVGVTLTVENGRELWAHITMNAKETKKDYTEVNGGQDVRVFTAEKPILKIESDTYSTTAFVDDGHSDNTIPMAPEELVREFLCVGDTSGNEAGSRTGVTVRFHPVRIRVPK